MRILIIADIHANLTALEAVLKHAQGEFNTVWCLGDLVGYGPQPNECVMRIREMNGLVCIAGNHDQAAIGKVDLNTFNPLAARALTWTQATLLPECRNFLYELQSIHKINGITLAHGSPRHPVWEYITDTVLAKQNFSHFTGQICIVGHTHIPHTFHHDGNLCEELIATDGKQLRLKPGRHILNPGAVGQPRDHNPRASYALLDIVGLSWEQRRVGYNIAETQRCMRSLGLPEPLIERLHFGA